MEIKEINATSSLILYKGKYLIYIPKILTKFLKWQKSEKLYLIYDLDAQTLSIQKLITDKNDKVSL